MPSGLSLSLKVAPKIDTPAYTCWHIRTAEIQGKDSLVFIVSPVAADTAADTLLTGDLRFSYSEDDWQRFYERKSLIDDYYASAAMLDSLSIEAAGWDMTDQQSLPFNYVRLSELVRFLALVDERRFDFRLPGEGSGPKRLPEKHLQLYKTSRSCLYNFTETLEKSGAISGYTSPDSISDYLITRLLRYIRLSSLLDDIHGKIYLDYLSSYYNRQVFDNEPEIIQSMLIRMFPEARQDTLLAWASETLMGAYRRKASELVEKKKYSDAFLLMENAHSMVLKNPYLASRNGWEQLMSESVNGIYTSYAGIAASSFEAGNTNLAMEYLSKAEKYREQYPALITSDSTYRRVCRAIFLGRMDHCDRLLEKGYFADALDCLQGFERSYTGKTMEVMSGDLNEKMARARTGIIMALLSKTSKALKHNEADSALNFYDQAGLVLDELPENNRIIPRFDSLASPIASIRFRKTNNLAEAYFRQRQFARAILQFEQAYKLANIYAIPSDHIADSLYTASYKQWLLDRISQEQNLIWNNKTDSANDFLALTSETARSKGLGNDPDILQAISSYRLRMQDQKCSLLEDSITLLKIRAGKCFTIRNFSRGVNILRHAFQIEGQSPWCKSDMQSLQDSLNKYDNPACYQKRLEDATFCIAAGDFEQGIQLLATNERFYSANRIDNFGLPLVPLYDFVLMKGNPNLTIRVLDYYMLNSNPDEALHCLLLLQVEGVTEDRSSPYQERLARLLAARDKLAYAKTDPQSLLRQYTSLNPWMNRFSSVYLLEWKK
jgi:hypothetical protein